MSEVIQEAIHVRDIGHDMVMVSMNDGTTQIMTREEYEKHRVEHLRFSKDDYRDKAIKGSDT